jgi:CBS domain containing-hemolysin-like protein
MALMIIYLFIALFFSFICSILEAVVLSITPSYISIALEEKSHISKDLIRIRDDIDRPLSAILTLNTFAHTLGAAGVGAQAQDIWGNEYLSVISAVLTVLILIFSEIIPKTLGASYWRSIAPVALRILRVIIILLYPFVLLSSVITSLIKPKEPQGSFTRKDIHRMAEIIRKQGDIVAEESFLIKNLLQFDSLKVKNIMTPRTAVTALQEDTQIKSLKDEMKKIHFSRIPIFGESIDTVTGFVLRDDILKEQSGKSDKTLKSLKRDINAVSMESHLLKVMQIFLKENLHISMVIDEYGGVAGIVTLEDLIESLLGQEIVDELDRVEDMQQHARDKWQKDKKKKNTL